MTPRPPEPRRYTLKEIGARVNGSVRGDADIEISGIAGIGEAVPGEMTFVSNPKYLSRLSGTRASAVIVAEAVEGLGISQLVVSNPYFAFSQVVSLYHAKPYVPSGVSPRAEIGRDVRIGADVSIHPFVTVENGAVIGDRVTLHSGVVVGEEASVGNDTILHANVTVRDHAVVGQRVIIHSGTVIGSDGFGFATHQGRHQKILQVGRVRIEDDVEIGANCAVDRAAMGETVIGKGTKIDNLVQVAHNVKIGENCILVAQVGVSGSTELGQYVTLAGQVGVVGHVRIGDRVTIGAKSGVSKDIPAGEAMSGIPAMAHRKWLAAQAVFGRLPELRKRINAIEQRLASIEKQRRRGSSGRGEDE